MLKINMFGYSIWFILIICSFGHSTKPKLTEIVHNRSQNIGTKFQFVCSTEEGLQPLRFEWHRNGLLLSSKHTNKYRIDVDQDQSRLIIDKLSVEDTGNYTCTVFNPFGQDLQFILLTVKGLIINFSVLPFSNDMWRIIY